MVLFGDTFRRLTAFRDRLESAFKAGPAAVMAELRASESDWKDLVCMDMVAVRPFQLDFLAAVGGDDARWVVSRCQDVGYDPGIISRQLAFSTSSKADSLRYALRGVLPPAGWTGQYGSDAVSARCMANDLVSGCFDPVDHFQTFSWRSVFSDRIFQSDFLEKTDNARNLMFMEYSRISGMWDREDYKLDTGAIRRLARKISLFMRSGDGPGRYEGLLMASAMVNATVNDVNLYHALELTRHIDLSSLQYRNLDLNEIVIKLACGGYDCRLPVVMFIYMSRYRRWMSEWLALGGKEELAGLFGEDAERFLEERFGNP